MKTYKKIVAITVFLLVVFLSVGSINVYAASTKGKALKAYKAFLEKYQPKYTTRYSSFDHKNHKVLSNSSEAVLSFSIIYLDNDNIPEMIVNKSSSGKDELFTYNNNKVVLMNNNALGLRNYVKGYYKKKGIIEFEYESNGWPEHSITETYCSKNGNSLITKLKVQKNVNVSNNKETGSNKYFSCNKSGGEKKISKSNYKKKLKKNDRIQKDNNNQIIKQQ